MNYLHDTSWLNFGNSHQSTQNIVEPTCGSTVNP